jgi:AcrR family transcriptional regulator
VAAERVREQVVRERGIREQHKLLTRNRVLDAAVTVFAEKSFAHATMDEVARAAGVTRATVYAHFADKNDLVAGLAARVYESTDRLYAELAAHDEWTRDLIRAWVESAADTWRRMAPTISVLSTTLLTVVGDAATAQARNTDARERYWHAHQSYVDRLAGDFGRWADVDPAEAQQRALMSVLQLESFLSLWIARGWPVKTDDPLDLLTDDLCHLLAPALRG